MSVSSPLGYPDWQRLTNWDGPIVWELAAGNYNAQQNSPVVRVDHFQSFAGLVNVQAGTAAVIVEWYADSAKTVALGARELDFDGSNALVQQAILRLVNQGPWAQVSAVPLGASFTVGAPWAFEPTNRAFPTEVPPLKPVLIDAQAVNVPASTTVSRYSANIAIGRAHLFASLTGGQSHIGLFAFNPDGTYHLLDQVYPDANGIVNLDLDLPPASLRMNISNADPAHATTAYATLTAGG